jgi:hypothetical protein
MEEKQKYIKDILLKIKNLTIKEKYHILSIFKKYNIEFTRNSNGYFFNLDKIDINILNKVSKCINLIEEKRELIMTLDKKREAYLEYYKNLIDNKLKDTINKKQSEYIQKLILRPSPTYIKKIKSKHIKQSKNVDPDILIKDYIKSKKISKDSQFYKINTLISKNSNNNKIIKDKCQFEYIDEYRLDEDEYSDDIEIDVDIGAIDDVIDDDVIDDDVIDNDNTNEVNDMIDDVDFERSDEYYTEEYYSDDNEKSDEIEKSEIERRSSGNYDYESYGDTKSNKKNSKKSYAQVSLNEIDYYKNLLKQSGFKFDEYKSIKIKIEDYIQ